MRICKTKEVITTSGNLAAILDFWHTSTSHDIGSNTTRKADPENVVVAVGMLMLCVIVPRILLHPVSWLPSWISSTRRRPTKPEVLPLESLAPKHGVAVEMLSLCALELEICLGAISPPVAGKRRKNPLPGEGLMIRVRR